MLNSAFDRITGNTLDFSPEALRAEIDAVNARVYDGFNNGVYRAGFASTQAAYDRAVAEVFATLDWLEDAARAAGAGWSATGRPRPTGDSRPRSSASTLVYHGHFKCNRRRLVDYPNLWAYARELYQWPGVAETVRFDHIAFHYYASHAQHQPDADRADRPRDRLARRRMAAPRGRRPDRQPPTRRLALRRGGPRAVVLDQRRHVLEPERRAQQAAGVRHQLEDRRRPRRSRAR